MSTTDMWQFGEFRLALTAGHRWRGHTVLTLMAKAFAVLR